MLSPVPRPADRALRCIREWREEVKSRGAARPCGGFKNPARSLERMAGLGVEPIFPVAIGCKAFYTTKTATVKDLLWTENSGCTFVSLKSYRAFREEHNTRHTLCPVVALPLGPFF